MAVIVAGNSYRFKSKSDNRYLNILTDGALSNNKNVTTYALDSTDLAQVWLTSVYSHGSTIQYLLKSAKDNNYVLDRWRGSSNYNNADIYTRGTTTDDLKDQVIVFVASGSYYKIKLANYDLYLTVTSTSTYGGYNVNWQAATGADNQLWLAELYSSGSSGGSTPSSATVENINQNDFGSQTGTNTFCYATCILAILRHYKGTSFTMDRLINEGLVRGSDGYVLTNNTTYYSVTGNLAINNNFSDICNEIEAGRPVIIYGESATSGHYVVADGFTSRTADGIIVMDPWTGSHKKLTESTLRTYTDYRKYTNK